MFSFIKSTKGRSDLIETIFDTYMNFLTFEYFHLIRAIAIFDSSTIDAMRHDVKRMNVQFLYGIARNMCVQRTSLIIHRMRHFLKIIQSTCEPKKQTTIFPQKIFCRFSASASDDLCLVRHRLQIYCVPHFPYERNSVDMKCFTICVYIFYSYLFQRYPYRHHRPSK